MKKKIISLIPYLTALAVIWYLLPFAVRNTGSAMIIMILIIPLLTFICAVIYGKKHGFGFLFPVSAIILFVPTIFIFYNTSAWIYIVIYAVIAFVGNVLGNIINQNK